MLAIQRAFFDGGRDRSGDLIQCGPALPEEAIRATITEIHSRKHVLRSMFQGVQPIQ